MPTYGTASQPLQSTFNYDALMSTSIAKANARLTDQVCSKNIFLKKIKEKGLYKKIPGAPYIFEDLRTAVSPIDAYDGLDTLPLTPTEGITQAQFQWRQMAVPYAMSEKERKMNKTRIIDLVAAKIEQLMDGATEGTNRCLLQGSLFTSSSGNLYSPAVSAETGAYFPDPLGAMVDFDPTQSRTVGGINQSTYTWWRNKTKTSVATTYTGLLAELLNLKNTCNLTGTKKVDIALCDQVTWELISSAYYSKYSQAAPTGVGDYPFDTIRVHGVDVAYDQYMGDVYSNAADCSTYGTLYFLTSDYLTMQVEEETDWVATDLQRPINQDAKYKHLLWMGNFTTPSRRNHGVLGKIARTLS